MSELNFFRAILEDESRRRAAFPVTADTLFMAHAGVSPLPRCAADALREFGDRCSVAHQENEWTMRVVDESRELAAKLIGALPDEIALLGPTSLGLSLVAEGLDWHPGDEVVFYQDDYPANVYPWMNLARLGVRPVRVETDKPGVITWEHVEAALTDRTKLVSLATCNFLSGYRIDVDTIGTNLGERGVLFCLDAIQTLGAFPLAVEHVDFLSADSHKWLLGPAGAGIFYVKKERQEVLRPLLSGAGNIRAPNFIALEDVAYQDDARRYEPGAFNLPGIAGMHASMSMLLETGVDAIARRLLDIREGFVWRLRESGYELFLDEELTADTDRSAIITVRHPGKDMVEVFKKLAAHGVVASLRRNRAGETFVRFSPHFYNTEEEIERVVGYLE